MSRATGPDGLAAAASAITAVWRHESTRLVAALTRLTRDLGLAEDLAQDALVAALEQWPATGVPRNPGGWLMAVARRRAVDHFRRADTLRRRTAELAHGLEETDVTDLDSAVDYVEDDVLRLMFLTCHPVLTPESRTALTLRLVGGLTTAEIARLFLVKETTMGQRLSRAKRTLADSGASFDLPTGAERRARLDDVLAAVYLVFTEGYAATAGEHWTRPELCHEALRLVRILTALVPDEPEAWGLQALLELQASRLRSRLDPDGRPVLLEDQDRGRWDRLLVRRGLQALRAAERLGGPIGSYTVQAAIAACHSEARSGEETDWARVARLYDILARMTPGPVVEVNRAVAHGRAAGPAAGLAILDSLDARALDARALTGSPLLPSVRGDLLSRAGRHAEAAESFRSAAAATSNLAERELLLTRAEQAASSSPAPVRRS